MGEQDNNGRRMKGNEGKGTGRNTVDRINNDCMFTITVDVDVLTAKTASQDGDFNQIPQVGVRLPLL